MATEIQLCCPAFDPATWDDREFFWQEKPFVKGRARCFLHIPLNYGSVLAKNLRLIEEANALSEETLVLSDENSLWGADMYIAVTKDVPNVQMVRLSGNFLAKVFEGPYRQFPVWIEEMNRYVISKGKQIGHLYFLYTTCPKCAKIYGKNYVVLFTRVLSVR